MDEPWVFLLVFPFANASVLLHLHNTQIKVIRDITLFNLLSQNSTLWSDVSLGTAVRERIRTKRRSHGFWGEGQRKSWSLSLCPRLLSLGGPDLKHIVGQFGPYARQTYPFLNICICVGTLLNQFDTLSSWVENAEFSPGENNIHFLMVLLF